MKILSSLADVAHNYSGFLIDLWGVMHGGAHAFPHALAALQHLRAHNKKIVLKQSAMQKSQKKNKKATKWHTTSKNEVNVE
ncbi:MAG: hypothetical protein EBZ69_10150, partial [Alphaproteobacteria bacterium]|nr:hypothetical protein [Alphaproteobacteria bacterium]